MLLSDADTAEWLSRSFVLSWENVREPAKVTIDFGEGRVLQRTLAGNTAFYLTTPDGTVVDVFPGVYTPDDFRNVVEQALPRAYEAQASDDPARAIREGHTAAFFSAYTAEAAKTTASKMYVESPLLSAMRLAGPELPPARVVPTAPSKGMVESPILRSLGSAPEVAPAMDPAERLDFEGFAARLEDISKLPATADAARRRFPIDDAMSEEERQMQIVRIDSQINVRNVRPAVHLMFRDAVRGAMKPQDMTRLVFKQLLHVDIDDPYLGLGKNLLPGTGG